MVTQAGEFELTSWRIMPLPLPTGSPGWKSMATLFQVEEFIVGLSMAVGAAGKAGAAVLVGTAKWVGAADMT